MKWDKIRFVGATNVDFPVLGADPSGPFTLKGVDGLDPPPRDVIFANTVEEGGVRQKKRTQNRQMVALVGLQPAWDTGQTSADLRNTLYGLLTPKYDQMVKAQLMLGETIVCQAQGDVSNVDASIFSKDPEVQITLDCDHPYLLAPLAVNQLPVRTTSGGRSLFAINNVGTAPSGFYLSFTLQQTIAGVLQIGEDSPDGRVLSISGPHAAGDTIIVDTRPGQRKVNRIKAGFTAQSSILNLVTTKDPWFSLHNGLNNMFINAVTLDWYGPGTTHTPAYWGA